MANINSTESAPPDGYYVIEETEENGCRCHAPLAGPLPTKESAYVLRNEIDRAGTRRLMIWRWESENV